MRTAKRIAGCLMALAILLTCMPYIPLTAEAAAIIASGTCGAEGDNLTWTLDSEGTLTISGTGPMKNYTYSSSAPWYGNRLSIVSAVIEDGVTSIGDYAFSDCSGLISITISDSVTSIGLYTFSNCTGLTNISLSNNLAAIGSYAFDNCASLMGLTIPDSVNFIDDGAFLDCCSIKSINIPDSVMHIGKAIFSGCSDLATCTIGNGVTSISSSMFLGCTKLVSITIPSGVTSIGSSAFNDCSSLSSVEIPEGVLSIGVNAFRNCSALKNLAIPDSIISISFSSFSGCDSLLYNTYDKGKYLGNDSNPYIVLVGVDSTDITSCEIHPQTKIIGHKAFSGCASLTSITIPDSVVSIELIAFKDCTMLTSIAVGSGVSHLGGRVFEGCESLVYNRFDHGLYLGNESNPYRLLVSADSKNVTACEIHPETHIIAHRAFGGCEQLASVVIPDSVVNIDSYAFQGCSALKEIRNSPNLTNIGLAAFDGCSSLTSISIPSGVTKIGDSAFSDCTSLAEVHILDLAAWCQIFFEDYDSNPLYYAENLYLNGILVSDLVIPTGVTSIKDHAFRGFGGLSVTIPESVTGIGMTAFHSCTNLTSITICDGVKYIGPYAFGFCSNLSNLSMGDTVISINYRAFLNCSNLTSITMSGSVTNMGGAFSGCDGLKHVLYTGTQQQWDTYCNSNIKTENMIVHVNSTGDEVVQRKTGYGTNYHCRLCNKNVSYASEVVKIAMQTPPNQRECFAKKDTLDVTGGVILITKSDGTSVEVPLSAEMVSGFNNTTPGKQALTVTLDGKSITYDVEITMATVTFLNADGTVISQTEYMYGDIVEVPHELERPSGIDESYVFRGWDKNVIACVGETTYQAVYGPPVIFGDFTGDDKVTDADVIYLLWYTVFPEDYPLNGVDADFNGDNEVTDADVIYLLWHTVFPEDYPLTK